MNFTENALRVIEHEVNRDALGVILFLAQHGVLSTESDEPDEQTDDEQYPNDEPDEAVFSTMRRSE